MVKDLINVNDKHKLQSYILALTWSMNIFTLWLLDAGIAKQRQWEMAFTRTLPERKGLEREKRPSPLMKDTNRP